MSGWDNRTFRLGDEMTVRMPSADVYVAQVAARLPPAVNGWPTRIDGRVARVSAR